MQHTSILDIEIRFRLQPQSHYIITEISLKENHFKVYFCSPLNGDFTSPEEESKNRMVSEHWIVQNVERTGRALVLSTTSAFAKISNRELPNV